MEKRLTMLNLQTSGNLVLLASSCQLRGISLSRKERIARKELLGPLDRRTADGCAGMAVGSRLTTGCELDRKDKSG
jgi:hypothetical protein